jgi:hypothetical protein
MTDYEAYKLYCALKRHFQSDSYDYFKYNGKVKVSYSAFEKRNDKYFFSKLAKHKDPVGFLVANLYDNLDIWIGDLVNEQATEMNYRDWLKKKQSLSYMFKSDMDIVENLVDEFKVSGGQHPKLLQRYLGRQIKPETLIIIDKVNKGCLFKYWNDSLSDPVWKTEYNKLIKLSPFIPVDLDKYKGIMDEVVSKSVVL